MKTSVWHRVAIAVGLSALCFVGACGGSRGDLVRIRDQGFDQDDILRVSTTVPGELIGSPEAVEWIIDRLVLEALANEEVLDEDAHQCAMRTARRTSLRKCIARKLGVRFASIDIEKEIRRLYDADPSRFNAPERAELQMIFIPQERPDAGRSAREILAATQAPDADFGSLAWRYSASESANRGGLTGLLELAQLAPEIRTAIRDHRDDPEAFFLSGPRGYYIIEVLKYFPAMKSSFEAARSQVSKQLARSLEDRLLEDFRRGPERFPEVKLNDELFRQPIVELNDIVCAFDGSEIQLTEILGGAECGVPVAGPRAFRLVQSYVRDHQLATALACSNDSAEYEAASIHHFLLQQALVKAAFEVTPEAFAEFLQLHQNVLMHESTSLLDLAIFPWGDDSPAAILDRSQELMDRLARGQTTPEEIRTSGSELFLGVLMSDTQAGNYDSDLASALRSMPPEIYSLPASSESAGGFLMVKLHERNAARPLNPDIQSDRQEIARIYLRSEGDRAVSRILKALKPTLQVRRSAIEDLIHSTRAPRP